MKRNKSLIAFAEKDWTTYFHNCDTGHLTRFPNMNSNVGGCNQFPIKVRITIEEIKKGKPKEFQKIWIKHKDENRQYPINNFFYRHDRKTICIDFRDGKSQIDIFVPVIEIKRIFKKSRV